MASPSTGHGPTPERIFNTLNAYRQTAASAKFIAQLIGVHEEGPCRVLDIAAGHGMYGITIAKENPNAQIVAVDWPPVLEVAKENAAAAFSLTMLAVTHAGDAYTFPEYEAMLRSAGYARTTKHTVPQMPSTVLVPEKTA